LYKAPRGTVDILPDEQGYWRYVRERAEQLAIRFAYRRIDTPMFEDAGLFVRSIGERTDIVEKEMYSFQDKGGDLITLRPEGTAPVCRAYIERGMHNLPQPVRLYYLAQIFRYERPQAGRLRQHHQVGFEAIGDASPLIDVELIEMAWRFLETLGLKDLTLFINSIGDGACRPEYLKAISGYYADKSRALCTDCQSRLERNPLRLLDCKKETCYALAESAPKSSGHLCDQCQDHFQRLQSYLGLLDVPFVLNHRLVRGLDYYTRTVFEVQPAGGGAQSTIIGGGRYDGLIQELGGRPTPGVGFATGFERIILNLKAQGIKPSAESSLRITFAYVTDETKEKAIHLASLARQKGVSAVLAGENRSLKAQLRYANALGTEYVVIVGMNDARDIILSVRHMADGKQWDIGYDDFLLLLTQIQG